MKHFLRSFFEVDGGERLGRFSSRFLRFFVFTPALLTKKRSFYESHLPGHRLRHGAETL